MSSSFCSQSRELKVRTDECGAFSPRRASLHARRGVDAMLFTTVCEFLFLPSSARRERDEKAYRCGSDDYVSRLSNIIESVASILKVLKQWNFNSLTSVGFKSLTIPFLCYYYYQYLKNHFVYCAREYRCHYYGWCRDLTKRRVGTSKAATDVSPVAWSRRFSFNYSQLQRRQSASSRSLSFW